MFDFPVEIPGLAYFTQILNHASQRETTESCALWDIHNGPVNSSGSK